MISLLRFTLIFSLMFSSYVYAETESVETMTSEKLDTLAKRLDPNSQRAGNTWTLKYEGYEVFMVVDASADRMRVMAPIGSAENLKESALIRLMQANFDSALDARYSIAQGVLWSAFIHPLSELTERQFFSGIAQSINLVATYGTTYSSGAVVFQGGDSPAEQQQRYIDILRKGQQI